MEKTKTARLAANVVRDRVKELRRVRAGELIPSPQNWRTHPQEQRDALRGILSEIGFAGAILCRETPAGLEIIDGHCRVEDNPDMEVPVLVSDLTEAEAKKLLLILSALGLGGVRVPPGIAIKLHGIGLRYLLAQGRLATRIIEAAEAVSDGCARYLGVRMEPRPCPIACRVALDAPTRLC